MRCQSQQEVRAAARDAAATVKEELRKLISEQRAAGKLLRASSHQAAQAAASLADKRAEITAVKESNQELQDQHIQETQVQRSHPAHCLPTLLLGVAVVKLCPCCSPCPMAPSQHLAKECLPHFLPSLSWKRALAGRGRIACWQGQRQLAGAGGGCIPGFPHHAGGAQAPSHLPEATRPYFRSSCEQQLHTEASQHGCFSWFLSRAGVA